MALLIMAPGADTLQLIIMKFSCVVCCAEIKSGTP